MEELIVKINHAIKAQKELNNYDGLQYMKCFVSVQIIPDLQPFFEEANIYRKHRDAYNVKTIMLMHSEHHRIRSALEHLDYVITQVMSSVGSGLNLLDGQSDIDIGIMIKGLNNDDRNIKYEETAQILTDLGFVYSHTVNNYHAFVNIVDGIEFELKVRDFDASKALMALSSYMTNNLSEEERTLFTYGKHLFKEFDKENPHHKAYVKFKKIVDEYAFANVEGGFVFSV